MRRREFVTLLGGAAAAWPLAARAQQAERMRRVGVLFSTPETDPEGKLWMAALTNGLKELGWVEGRNIEIARRWAPDLDELPARVAELLSLRLDLVVAETTVVVAAVLRMRTDIPIVFIAISDPVGLGFVASLAHPGGNVTGFTLFDVSVTGKLLEALKEIAPSLSRVAMIFTAGNPAGPGHLHMLEEAARPSSVKVVAAPVRNGADIEQAIESFATEPNGCLILPPDTANRVHRDLIVTLAARFHLPAAYSARSFVENGGLMSYGPVNSDNYRRAAGYVDRILKGEHPGDLPVQQPTKFDFAINLKTAKALGLTAPTSLLLRADEVIE